MNSLSSDHAKRWLTVIVLVPLLLVILFSGYSPLFFAFLLLVSGLCQREYLNMAFPGSEQTIIRMVGIALGTTLMLVAIFNGPEHLWSTFGALSVIAFSFFVVYRVEIEQALNKTACLALSLIYPPLLLSNFVFIWREHDSLLWILFMLGVVFAGDTGAFYAGRTFGRHKLHPRLSPKKTIEGSLGGLLLSVIFALVFNAGAGLAPWSHTITLAVILNVLGQAGDLFESLLKRSAGVKDSGSTLPGHGGMLDRIDGVLFAVPALRIFLEHF